MRIYLLMALLACAATAAGQDSKRLPLPGASDLEAAKKVVEDVDKKDYAAAKSAAQKRALVLRLQADALKTKDDLKSFEIKVLDGAAYVTE